VTLKFEIQTAKLNTMLSKVAKGVGNSKILPSTEYLKINLDKGELKITSTNCVNFITCISRGVAGTAGEIIVKADALIKLVAKTTKEIMTFVATETHVEVKGNGKYKIPLLETNDFPVYEFDVAVPGVQIDVKALKAAFAINKSAIATEMLMPCLTGYNVGDNCITTDGVKMCINNNKFPLTDRLLITQDLATLLNVLSVDKMTVQKQDNKLLFTSTEAIIFGTELDGLSEYPNISGITAVEFAGRSVVFKDQLTSAVDRLAIFVDPFDNNGIRMTFKPENLEIEDLKQNSLEVLKYVGEEKPTEPVTVLINIEYFKDIIGVLSMPTVDIRYGPELPMVKIVEKDVIQILSTMDQEDTTGAA